MKKEGRLKHFGTCWKLRIMHEPKSMHTRRSLGGSRGHRSTYVGDGEPLTTYLSLAAASARIHHRSRVFPLRHFPRSAALPRLNRSYVASTCHVCSSRSHAGSSDRCCTANALCNKRPGGDSSHLDGPPAGRHRRPRLASAVCGPPVRPPGAHEQAGGAAALRPRSRPVRARRWPAGRCGPHHASRARSMP